MKTYQEISNDITDLETKQRELFEKDTPTDSDKKEILAMEAEIASMRLEKDVIQLKEVKASGSEIVIADTPTSEEIGFRDLAVNDSYDIQFKRTAAIDKNGKISRSGRIREAKAVLQSDTGSGANLVPEEWHATVESYRFERNFLRAQGASVITTASTHNIPVFTDHGAAGIVGENTAYTENDDTIANVILNAYKLTRKNKVTEELLQDSIYDVEGVLAKGIGLSFGAGEEQLFLTGTGSSQPTGIFNPSADKTLASTSTVTTDELIEIVYGLARHYRNGASWMMNDATALIISKIKESVTSSGTTPYWWNPNAHAGEPDRLLGYPVFTNSNIATFTNDAKVICFGNIPFYLIGERGPINVKRLQLDEYSDTFAWHQRIDGKPLDENAFYVVRASS